MKQSATIKMHSELVPEKNGQKRYKKLSTEPIKGLFHVQMISARPYLSLCRSEFFTTSVSYYGTQAHRVARHRNV